MDTRKTASGIIAAMMLGVTIICPMHAFAREAAQSEPQDKVNVLSSEESQNAEIEPFTIRQAILARLQAAHKKGIFLDITEDQINSLTDEELYKLAKKRQSRHFSHHTGHVLRAS